MKPKSKMAIIPVDRPPDGIVFTGAYVPNDHGIYVPTNFLIAHWTKEDCTLDLLIVTESSRHEKQLTKALMGACKGSEIHVRRAALCKRIKP